MSGIVMLAASIMTPIAVEECQLLWQWRQAIKINYQAEIVLEYGNVIVIE